MRPMIDLYSHRLKRRLLVGCLTTLIGGPLMCCGLVALFKFALPAIDQASPADFPALLVKGGLGVFIILFVIALDGIAVYLYRRGFPGLSISSAGDARPEGLARFRQITILALVFGMPLFLLAIGVIAYLLVTRFG
jgi:hypothetical protein